MVFVDPKTTLLNLMKTFFHVSKDEASEAVVLVEFELPEQELLKSFETNDVIITVGRETEKAQRIATVAYFQYTGLYRLGVWVREKTGIEAESICTAAVQKIKDIIKVHEHDSNSLDNLSWIKKVNSKDDDRVGSPMLFHRIVQVQTVHYGQEG